ncbi:hypothetical protein LENED_004691 [Lentinula edodes]|uniref:Uncharacterized protein n=1 Tax=Lentinula edodes TaxID=5353 RepID=A0A1Q3E6Z2_LENED|nr:hypothetical protein LENED_004691 [Lentinula edodes]
MFLRKPPTQRRTTPGTSSSFQTIHQITKLLAYRDNPGRAAVLGNCKSTISVRITAVERAKPYGIYYDH